MAIGRFLFRSKINRKLLYFATGIIIINPLNVFHVQIAVYYDYISEHHFLNA
jgi:hypothetical protein